MQKATITRLVSELTEQKVRQLLVELLKETGSKTVAAVAAPDASWRP
jgi:hypothetical protein